MKSILELFETYLMVLVHPYRIHQQFRYHVSLPGQENHLFAPFQQALKDGRHIFFVDLYAAEEAILDRILKLHPQVTIAGTGKAEPHWLVLWQKKIGMIRHC